MPRTKIPLLLLAASVLAGACGTRLDEEAFAPSQQLIDSRLAGSDTADGATLGAPDESTGAIDAGREGAVTGAPDAAAAEAASSAPGAATDGGGAPAPGTPSAGSTKAPTGPNQASDAGVTETTIRLGNITAENGVLGDTFAPAVRGLRAWVAHTNATGGINGRKIELFTCDDREDRARTLECARRLVEQDQVFALLATNTRAMGGASRYLADKGIPVFGFPINNAYYRFPNFFNVYGDHYDRDGTTVGHRGDIISFSGEYRWYRQNLGVSKAAVFSYDISESAQAGERWALGLEAEGFEVQRYTVSFAAPSFDQAVADMQRRGIELIYDAMDDGANRRLCNAMTRRNFVPKVKVSTVVILGDGIEENYDEACRNVIYVTTESRSYNSNEPEVVEFRKAYAQYQPGQPVHQWAMEAWAIGNISQDAIESMGPAPTRKGFIRFLNTMKANTGDGIMIGTEYAPGRVDYDKATSRDCFGIVRWQDAAGWQPASGSFPVCYPDSKIVRSPANEQGT